MAFRIYTRTGDSGETGLYGGSRLPKHHQRIEAYGTIDELNAHIGSLYDAEDDAAVKALLLKTQNNLFTAGGMLAKDPAKDLEVPQIRETDVLELEEAIDAMEAHLEPLKQFILPSGHPMASMTHIARSVCRRAERAVVALHAEEPVDPRILKYLNRLADYLFVLARYLCKLHGGREVPWQKPE